MLTNDIEYTDVWDFPSVRPFRGKHPAEKPLDMLQHIIKASSYKNDTVLDCFAGSGSTAVASLKLGRRAIAMEIEDKWIARIVDDIADAIPEEQPITQSNKVASPSRLF